MKILFISLLFSINSFAISICPKIDSNGFCFLPMDKIHPTQFTIGYHNANQKMKDINKIFKKKGIEGIKEFINKKPTELIIGPYQKIYINDRHHTSVAILNSDIPNEYKHIKGKIIADLSNLQPSEFWKVMKEKKWTFLKDEKFKIQSPYKLPQHLNLLKDNPYRSMATILIEEDHIIKYGIPFEEFYWAEFFYKHNLRIPLKNKNALDEAKPLFVEFLKTKAALDFAKSIQSNCSVHLQIMKSE